MVIAIFQHYFSIYVKENIFSYRVEYKEILFGVIMAYCTNIIYWLGRILS